MAKFQLIAWVLLAWFWFSCSQQEEQPVKLLQDDEMVSALVALHLAEARADMLKIPADSLRPLLKNRYEQVFEELQIDTAEFNATFAYYEKHPGEMDSLYQKVIDRLVEMEANYRTTASDSTIIPDTTATPKPIAVDSTVKGRKLRIKD